MKFWTESGIHHRISHWYITLLPHISIQRCFAVKGAYRDGKCIDKERTGNWTITITIGWLFWAVVFCFSNDKILKNV